MIPKHWKHAASAATLVVCLAAAAPCATAQEPDNSAHNKNQSNQAKSADTQSNTKSDRDITAQIRKDIMANKDLSTYAHNVKIVTKNGAVTLKGPVNSADEKAKVAEIAANVVSADKVTNELTVK